LVGKFEHLRNQDLIPGGAHTYSRGDDVFPENAPRMLTRGRGAWVWDDGGRKYLDWAMAVRSVSLGHADRRVDLAAFRLAKVGINLSRPTPEEFVLAKRIVGLFPGADMVKFGKNGSDATAAAIRLSRAVTGRDMILRSDESQFLGVHDWFIGSTVMDSGVPRAVKKLTDVFRYGDLLSLETKLQQHKGKVAAVVLEPLGLSEPAQHYLRDLVELCHSHGCLVVFDEVVSGFRVGLRGYQGIAKVSPDLSVFGKAIANGYPLSALAGRRDVMELGGITHEKRRVFLMSSTYGPERVSIGAALATLDRLEVRPPFESNTRVMRAVVSSITNGASRFGLLDRVKITGMTINPNISFLDLEGRVSYTIKTAFMREMVKRGVLLGFHLFSVSASHGAKELSLTLAAVESSMEAIAELLGQYGDEGLREQFPVTLPVFRTFNR